MKTINVTEIERNYANWGNHAEQCLCYTLTGEIHPHDHVAFDKGSDIETMGGISVKSSGFTLASAKVNHGETFDEKLDDYKTRVHSTVFAYVSLELVAYMMNLSEFEDFIRNFCYFNRESTRNGGGWKIKCRKESKKMLRWLDARVTA